MKQFQEDQEISPEAQELKRVSIISQLAVLLFGLSMVLDGPITVLSWILSATGMLCLMYVVVASRSAHNQNRSKSRKADTQ